MALEHDRLAGIDGVVAPPGLAETSKKRRTGTKIKRMHHHAIFTKDPVATRHFYEDILEMKMVMTLRDEGDIAPKSPTPFLHIFFEMADGSMLAFFEAIPIHHNETYQYPAMSIFDHHLSVLVDDLETQAHYKSRLETAGYKVFELDHGFCHSIYVDDPNGIHMEISCNTDEYDDYMLRSEIVAPEQLDAWTKIRNEKRGFEDMRGMKVDVPDSWGAKTKVPAKEKV